MSSNNVENTLQKILSSAKGDIIARVTQTTLLHGGKFPHDKQQARTYIEQTLSAVKDANSGHVLLESILAVADEIEQDLTPTIGSALPLIMKRLLTDIKATAYHAADRTTAVSGITPRQRRLDTLAVLTDPNRKNLSRLTAELVEVRKSAITFPTILD